VTLVTWTRNNFLSFLSLLYWKESKFPSRVHSYTLTSPLY
jgi:hypothetical protein